MLDEQSGRRPRVLIVDDEEIILRLLERQLIRLNGDPVAAESARGAIIQVQEHPTDFDLVIADLYMPEMSGLDLAKAIHDVNPSLPILLCTGDDAALAGRDLSPLGIVGVLVKPMTTAAFAAGVINALQKHDSPAFKSVRMPTQ